MNKKKVAIIISVFLVVGLALIGGYYYLNRQDQKTTLTIVEKKWIENNRKEVIDFSILNDVPVISYSGDGIFFDFLADLEAATSLSFNKTPYNKGSEAKSSYALKMTTSVADEEVLIYKDNYALVTKDSVKYENINEISNITIGILNNELDNINNYLKGANVTFKSYENINAMLSDLKSSTQTISAIALPVTTYLDKILNNDLNIAYNITEYQVNYVISLGNADKLNTIIKKYYNKWYKEKYEESFAKHFSDSYFKYKNIDDKDVVNFRSKRYIYGFVDNAPFDTLINGKLSGFNKTLLESFSKVTGVEISYKKVSNNISSLLEAFNSNDIDFMFNNSSNVDYKVDVYNTNRIYDNEMVIITNLSSNLIVNSLNSLNNVKVSVLAGSSLEEYLKNNNIDIKAYDNIDKLLKNVKDDSIIALDKWTYDYAIRNSLKKFKVAYSFKLPNPYTFLVRDIKDNAIFKNYLNFYISFINSKKVINAGYKDIIQVDHAPLILRRVIIGTIIIISIVGVLIIINFLSPKKSKKRNKTLTKEEKLKYIDMLTSLKNRNYLNDNLEKWDDSEIYPQTIIVVDLNNVAYINDNYGHAEGDKVIKEAANILIKSQLPNTDIIRTNGNEFLIYMVEYDEKQVISYIRKLTKEFKELAHGFGAAIGYSMIQDAIKTVDDAVNEATLDMRSNKEETSN